DLSRSTGYRVGEGTALLNIAEYQQRLGRLADAASSYENARALFDSIGSSAMTANALAGLGNVAHAEGRPHAAVDYLQKAIGIMRSGGEDGQAPGVLRAAPG